MQRAHRGVVACAMGQTGSATVSAVLVGSTGRVASASISGAPFAGTPVAQCMALVVRTTVRVRPFARPSASVRHTFSIP
ncbi:MAG: hypothetical protein IT379_39860 [Deltaproteobacteria bacterium]|nr:hypothetical protein [Deltaproteobacteria bacterium]